MPSGLASSCAMCCGSRRNTLLETWLMAILTLTLLFLRVYVSLSLCWRQWLRVQYYLVFLTWLAISTYHVALFVHCGNFIWTASDTYIPMKVALPVPPPPRLGVSITSLLARY